MNTTPQATLLLANAHHQMEAAVETETYNTPERSQRRFDIIAGLYDDESDEPQTIIIDILTDLLHEAARRGVDIHSAVIAAQAMETMEIQDWGYNPALNDDEGFLAGELNG